MTNADKIRQMTDEELAEAIMCPYDTWGDPVNVMPCIETGKTGQECIECTLKWLRRKHND